MNPRIRLVSNRAPSAPFTPPLAAPGSQSWRHRRARSTSARLPRLRAPRCGFVVRALRAPLAAWPAGRPRSAAAAPPPPRPSADKPSSPPSRAGLPFPAVRPVGQELLTFPPLRQPPFPCVWPVGQELHGRVVEVERAQIDGRRVREVHAREVGLGGAGAARQG